MLVILAMLVTAACGGNSSSSNNNSGSTTPPANSGSTEAPAPAPAEDKLAGEKPTLRQLQPYDRMDPNADPTAKLIEEKTGYKSVYEMLPEEMPNEKLNLLMANQEKYDIMRLNKEQFFTLAEAGALAPLNDLIDQYGPNLKAGINQSTWDAATIDGTIYAIPQGGTGIDAAATIVLRKDWLEELGLAVPTNRDELYNVLKAFKEKKNVIPLVGNTSIQPEIAASFGIYNAWDVVDGQLVNQAEHPNMKNYLAFMNKLYTEGLIDSEWPINTGSTAIEKFTSGKAGAMRLAWWSAPSVYNALAKNFPDAEIALVPFLPNDQGEIGIGASVGVTYFMAIPAWSENKEHAMNFMNMKLEEDLFKELVIGKEGVHHKVEDGKYFPILPAFDELNSASFFLTGVDERVYATYWQARVRKDPILFSYYEELQALINERFVIDPTSTMPPIKSVSENVQKLSKFSDDTFLRYIANAESLDNFDSYLAQWKADGGEQMANDVRAWYNSQK